MSDFASDLPPEVGVVAGPEESRSPSLKRNSAARFLADAAGLVFGTLSSAITARALGPADKGLFSSLTLLAAIAMWICSIGLGDAAIVLVGQKRATMQQALSATLTAVFCSSILGTAMLWGTGLLAFRKDWHETKGALAIACLALPISLMGYILSFLLSAQERIAANSAVVATTSVVTAIALILFVGIIPLSIAGGTIANGVGSGAGLLLAAWLLHRSGLSFRPRFDRGYVVDALRYGVSVAVSNVVTVMFLRVDLLLSYALAGPNAAGQYSVALSVAALVGLLPIAISHATFPRLAKVREAEANELTVQAFRHGMAAAVSAASVLLVAVPIGLPLLFGRAYVPAIIPTLILLPGSVLWSCQWLLCRAAAARGRPGLLLRSFMLGLAVMMVMDYILIPLLGITGAALSAVAGPLAGISLCLFSYHRWQRWTLSLTSLVPRPGDVPAFIKQSLELLPFRSTDPARDAESAT